MDEKGKKMSQFGGPQGGPPMGGGPAMQPMFQAPYMGLPMMPCVMFVPMMVMMPMAMYPMYPMAPMGGPQGGPPRGRRPKPEFEDEKQPGTSASEGRNSEEKA